LVRKGQKEKELASLAGIAYRIPTQKQNSIDVFKIKNSCQKIWDS
jgi:hypothetical protein